MSENISQQTLTLWSRHSAAGDGSKDSPFELTPQNSPDGYYNAGDPSGSGNSASTQDLQNAYWGYGAPWFDLAGGSLMVNSSGTYNGYLNPAPNTPDNNRLHGSENSARGHVNNDSEIWFSPSEQGPPSLPPPPGGPPAPPPAPGTGSPFHATINIDVQQNNPSGFLIYASTPGWYDWSVEWWPPGTGPDGKNNIDGENIVKIIYEGNGPAPRPQGDPNNSSITVTIKGNPWDIPKDHPHFVNSSDPGPDQGQGQGPWHVTNPYTGDKNGPLDIGTKYDDGWHIYSPWAPYPVPCFLKGAMIETSIGLVPVEQLKVGDAVRIFPSREFVGILEVKKAVHQVPVNNFFPDEAGWPVLIEKDAFAENVPDQDLRVTPEHCFFLRGAFIPVRMLVNNQNVRYDFSESLYTYYHIKLEKHSIISANNALTESCLGQDESWESHAAAPLRTDRAFAETLWSEILKRKASVTTPVAA